MAAEGGEVMVKPPALGMVGMNVSSHWPGRNYVLVRRGEWFFVDGSGWTTDFDGSVRVGRRETQDTCCGVDFADVSYGDRFDLVLARFGCCTVLVRNGMMDYCCHGSFDGSLREKMWKWKKSRGDSVEGLCEHDLGLYEIISILGIVCWSFYHSEQSLVYIEM